MFPHFKNFHLTRESQFIQKKDLKFRDEVVFKTILEQFKFFSRH